MELKGNYGYEASLSASLSASQQQFKGSLEVDGKKMDANIIMTQYTLNYQLNVSSFSDGNFKAQSALEDPFKLNDILKSLDFEKMGYSGKPLKELSQEEATELVGEDGFFGIKQTAQRIADFVINGAGGAEDLLKAGREGVYKGYKQAEDSWGGKLPDISQETIKEAIKLIDEEFQKRGFSALDTLV